MHKLRKQQTLDATWLLLLITLASLVMFLVLGRTHPELAAIQRGVYAALLPVSVFIFHVITNLTSAPGKRRKARLFDQWNSTVLLPGLILGLVAGSELNLCLGFSVITSGYIVWRMLMFCYFRQTKQNPRRLDHFDALTVFCGQILLIGTTAYGVEKIPLLTGIVAAVINTAIAFLIALAIAAFTRDNSFSGSHWQRFLFVGTTLSIPLLSHLTDLSFTMIPVLGTIGVISMIRAPGKLARSVTVVGACLVIGSASVISPGYVTTALWLLGVVLIYQRLFIEKESRFLWVGGFSVLFLGAVFVAYLQARGVFPENSVFPFPSPVVLIGSFINLPNGLLLVAPLFFLPLSGWVLSLRTSDWLQRILWIGWPISLLGIVLSNWLQTGQLPEIGQWYLPAVCLIPYAGKLWPIAQRCLLAAWIRILIVFSVSLSTLLWILNICYPQFGFSMESLLTFVSRQSGLDLSRFFPQISHAMPIATPALYTGTIICCGVVVAILLSRTVRCRSYTGVPDAIIFCIVLVAGSGLIYSARVWYRVPINGEIELQPGQRWSTPLKLNKQIVALEIESRMGMSTHLTDGIEVVSITVDSSHGHARTASIIIGEDTAEWAYDRPDVMKIVQHSRPELARSWSVEEPGGHRFNGHAYRSLIILPTAVTASNLILENTVSDGSRATLTVSDIRLLSGTQVGLPAYKGDLIKENYTLTPGKRWSHTLKIPTVSNGVIIDSFLENAAAVQQGTVVAQVLARSKTGVEKLYLLRAGIDTAEWAIDRPDMIGHTRHKPASYCQSDRRTFKEEPYLAHSYRTTFHWDQDMVIDNLEISFLLDASRFNRSQCVLTGVTFF